MVGYDGTDGAKAAVDEATRLGLAAGRAGGRGLRLRRRRRRAARSRDLAAALRDRGDTLTAEALDALRAAGVEAHAEVVHGKPGEALARARRPRSTRR